MFSVGFIVLITAYVFEVISTNRYNKRMLETLQDIHVLAFSAEKKIGNQPLAPGKWYMVGVDTVEPDKGWDTDPDFYQPFQRVSEK